MLDGRKQQFSLEYFLQVIHADFQGITCRESDGRITLRRRFWRTRYKKTYHYCCGKARQ